MKAQGKILLSLIISILLSMELMGQSVLKPEHAFWKADESTVSLSKGYNEGISKPTNLSFVMFFDQEIIQKYGKGDLSFEFIWFHYYTTEKEYMDSYTVKYNLSNVNRSKKYEIKSSRGNILSGWWEVRVKARYDGKNVRFRGMDKFQIYVK